MRYVSSRNELTLAGETYGLGDEIKNFEAIPSRNQYSLINLGWVKAVAEEVDEPTPNKSKTKTNTKRGRPRKGAVEQKEGE